MTNSVQALYIINQSWCVRSRDLQKTKQKKVKAMQTRIHVMYVRNVESMSVRKQSQTLGILGNLEITAKTCPGKRGSKVILDLLLAAFRISPGHKTKINKYIPMTLK